MTKGGQSAERRATQSSTGIQRLMVNMASAVGRLKPEMVSLSATLGSCPRIQNTRSVRISKSVGDLCERRGVMVMRLKLQGLR